MRIRDFAAGLALFGFGCSSDTLPATPGPPAPPPEVPPPPPPEVSAMDPTAGPYGSAVTISGSGFTKSFGSKVVLGGESEREVPYGDSLMTLWGDDAIQLRFPFPNEGDVSITTPSGSVFAGEFLPSWAPGSSIDVGDAEVRASVSARPGHIAIALSTAPIRIVEIEPSGVTERSIDLTGAQESTLRLYAMNGETHGVVLSSATPPEILHIAPDVGGLKVVPTGIMTSSMTAVAGGSDGAVVWFREGDDWTRARHGEGGWAIDKGPIPDPKPVGKFYQAAATSDGSLFIGWGQDSNGFFDDTGTSYLSHVTGDAVAFSGAVAAGTVDDYLTSLQLEGHGPGLLIQYCGTDTGPFSDPESRCYDTVRFGDGELQSRRRRQGDEARWAFTATSARLIYCDETKEKGLLVTHDPEVDPGEIAIWPCGRVDVLEVDAAGAVLPVVRVYGYGKAYSPRKRDDGGGGAGGGGAGGGGGGGAGGSGGAGGAGGSGGGGGQGGGGGAGGGPTSTCCMVHATPGCDQQSVSLCVCQTNLTCCTLTWGSDCVDAVEANGCGQCP